MIYLLHLLILIAIFSILGLSLNLVVGYTGLLSVSHAAFYGVGAYTTAILMTKFGFSFLLTLPVGIILSMLAAFLIGLVLSKFDGDYYALASLGFGVIAFSAFLNLDSVTQGPRGIPGIPRAEVLSFVFSSHVSFFLFAALLLLITYLAMRFVRDSSFGRVLKAIREDEGVTRVFGYKTLYYKLGSFVISAGFAAVAGSLYATYISFVDPTSFTILESVFMLVVIILGGLASLRGSILGAAIFIVLPEILRFMGLPPDIAAQMRQAVYGVLLIALMIYRPQGILGKFRL